MIRQVKFELNEQHSLCHTFAWTNHFWTPCNWMILHSAWCPSHFQIKHSIQQSIKLHFDFRNGKFWFNLQNTFMSISPGHGRKTRVFHRKIKLRRKLLSSSGPWSHIPNGQTSHGETQISERISKRDKEKPCFVNIFLKTQLF